MSNINIKRFVDINIIHHIISPISSLRDTTVLLSSEWEANKDETYISLSDFITRTNSQYTTTLEFAKIYFNNGGNKLRVIYGITDVTLASTVNNLSNKYIVVAYTGTYDKIKEVAVLRNANEMIYGINQKLLLGRTESIDTDIVKNFVSKYSTKVGAEMTVAAYLSQIDIYGINTIHDYAFTIEKIDATESDDTVLGQILTNNMNVDMILANEIRNLGGNTKDGLDLVNEFVLIILHQTLTERLLNLLTQKIKGQNGIAAIHATLVQELNKFITNGYLSTDKIWTDRDLKITYNNQTYTIIESNTPLISGYKIKILPLISLTEDDKLQHKTPPIYITIADSYGIRKLTINGDVI